MEFLLSALSLVLFLPILFLSRLSLTLFASLVRRTARARPSNLPPGPPQLPRTGNLHNLIGSYPHRVLRDLSENYGPLMHLQVRGFSVVVVSSPGMAKEILQTHDVFFASRPSNFLLDALLHGSRGFALAPYGERWRRVREIFVTELLSMRRVQSFGNVRREECSELVRWIASNTGSPVNLYEKLLSMSYGNVSRVVFGGRNVDHEEFATISKEVRLLFSEFITVELFSSSGFFGRTTEIRTQLESLNRRADRIVQGIIQDHKENSGRRKSNTKHDDDRVDLIDVLLKYERNEGTPDCTLTMENVKSILMDPHMGGSYISAITVHWALAEMIRNPVIIEKAQAEVRGAFEPTGRVEVAKLVELKYLKMVIKETLRMHPPLPLVPRECREKCEIHGYVIPARTTVIINAWAINRDPMYWKDGETFDPERFWDSSIDFRGSHFEFVPFGGGSRICPGLNFCIANIELLLAMLLYHFDWELPDGLKGENLDMKEKFNLFGERKNDLFLIPKVHHSLPNC